VLEFESGAGSFIPKLHELLARSFYRNGVGWEPSLGSKNTSRSTLAREAVTDRDPNRVGCDVSLKLAAAGSGAMDHQ
jgi:hypothetical protein